MAAQLVPVDAAVMQVDNDIIAPGDMREKIEIQESTVTQNASGEPVNTWATITSGRVWAEARQIAGREFAVARLIAPEASFVFIIRYNSTITPRHRILYRSVAYDINAVDNVNQRRHKMVLYCKASI
jgi:SPP1 family predicted phage head-tail adaptor